VILERKRRHLERYIEIGRILAKHGWENLVSRIGLTGVFRVRRRPRGVPPGPEQVRKTLEELGPAFIKLGQVLSTRPDIVPVEYAAELEKLQDAAPTIPIEQVYQVIEEEFSEPATTVFAGFDEKPLAAASLGQTHVASLADGTEVVVKIQRPGVRQVIENDLEIISGVTRFLEQHVERLRIYALSDLIDELAVTIRQELDYTREGRNGDVLRQNFADTPYVRIAGTIWDYTTQRVLTSERIRGTKITDVDEIQARGYDRRQIAANLSRAFLKMVFVDGFFHADPHPGNLAVLEENVVALLDYGMAGRLGRDLKSYITMLLAEYIQEDSAGFSEVLLSMGTAPADIDRKAFTQDMDRLLRQYYGAPTRQALIGEVLRRSLRISAKHRVRLPASLGLLIKVILGVEGIDRRLDPDFDLAAEAKPFIVKAARSELSLSTLREQAVHTLLYWKWLLLELPHRTSEVLERMAEGTFRIVFKHEGLDKPIRDIDKSANRLSFAIVSSATIIASALVLSARVGPTWKGYPVLGLIGFGISFLFGLWLMISIIRAGKLW